MNNTADQAMHAFLRAASAVEDRLESALTSVGLSAPKFAVLTELVSANEPLPLCELASRLSCVRSNITQLIDRLEADGLVKRIDDPADRRSVRAELTSTGRERQKEGAERVDLLQSEFAATIAGTDREALERVLAALV